MRTLPQDNWVSKFIALAPLMLATWVAVVIGSFGIGENDYDLIPFISDASMNEMRALNYKYSVVKVEDLLDDSDSRMVANLVQANVLAPPDADQETFKGLIATVGNENGGDGVLLLESAQNYSDEALEAIAEEYENLIPEFLDVELDQELELSGWPVYHLSPDTYRIGIPRRVEAPQKNAIRVAVIDSGVDPDHEIFDDSLESGWNAVDNNAVMYDDVGHGTHISGIIRMSAPGATIIPYKIVDADGGRLSNVIKAFDKAVDQKVDIINTSFGILSESLALETVVRNAVARDILVVSAAGNLNSDSGFYPATYGPSIAVAGVDNLNRKMAKSNYGDWVDVASYGTYIWSALPGDDYGHKSGTSQSTAYVTAAVVRLFEEKGSLSAEDALKELARTGKEVDSGPLAGLLIVE